jgi:hypothetical protein
MKSMMKTLSRDWVGFSRICHHTHPAQSPSTPRLVHQTRLVIELLSCSSRAHPNCLLHDDLTKFFSNPASSPRLVDIPEEGKGKAKERREVGEGDDTVTIEDTPTRRTGRRCRSGSGCGPGLAVLDCPTFPLSTIHRLA